MIELREATGLTQQLLADLMQIPRGVLAMCELGRRGHASDALQKLVSLLNHVPPSAKEEDLPLLADVLANETTLAKEKVDWYKEGCKIKAANKQRALNNMTKKYEQSLRLLQTLRAMSAALPQDAANADIHDWIHGATAFAELKLSDNSLAKQQLLALEIRQLLTA